MNDGIREFREIDAHELNLMSLYRPEHTERENFVSGWKRGAMAYTICFPGTSNPMACIGAQLIFSKVLAVWMLVDEDVKHFPIHYIKCLRKLCQKSWDKFNLNRIEFYCQCDQDWPHRWARILDFQLEARCRKYGESGQDHFLFAKVRE